LGVAACGGATTAPPAAKAPEKAAEDANKPAPAGAAVAAPVEKAEDALPTKVGSLFQFVGKDAPLVVSVPRLDKVIAALDPETRETIMGEVLGKITKESRFESAVAKGLVDGFDGAVLFADPDKANASEKETAKAACVAARFRDPKPVELALSGKEIDRDGPRFSLTGKSEKDVAHGVWLADSGVLLGCMTRDALHKALVVSTGGAPSFTSSPRFVPERANDVFVSVEMRPLVGDKIEAGSNLFASLATEGPKLGLDLRLALYGADFPPVGSVIDAAPQALLGKMPKGTIGAFGLSLKRASGKNLTSVLGVFDKSTDGHTLEQARQAAAMIGVDFNDIDAALGDEIAVGVYRDPKYKIDFESSKSYEHSAVLVSIAAKDEGAYKKLWNSLTTAAKKAPKKAKVSGDVIESIENPKSKDKSGVRVEARKGLVVIGVGDKSVVKEALGKFGKDKETLASNPAFAEARAKEKPAVHMLGFVDSAALKAIMETKGEKAKTDKFAGGPAFLSLLLGPSDRGIEVSLGGGGAMELIGMGASLAVAGVKAYAAESKASEARMNVRFMSSYARRAYERESEDGKGPRNKLCKSSLPVPAAIPKATTYKTSMSAGGDWDSGDENTGWKCLQYFSNDEVRYQYEYRQGGSYKGPKRGGPDPGKDGFEISAEGDLDGDGKTSLFTRTGKIVKGKIVLDDDVFEADPKE
jgi:hypothetical protein